MLKTDLEKGHCGGMKMAGRGLNLIYSISEIIGFHSGDQLQMKLHLKQFILRSFIYYESGSNV